MEHKFIRCGATGCGAIMRLRGKGMLWCRRCDENRAQVHFQNQRHQTGAIKGITPIGAVGFVRA